MSRSNLLHRFSDVATENRLTKYQNVLHCHPTELTTRISRFTRRRGKASYTKYNNWMSTSTSVRNSGMRTYIGFASLTCHSVHSSLPYIVSCPLSALFFLLSAKDDSRCAHSSFLPLFLLFLSFFPSSSSSSSSSYGLRHTAWK